MHLNSLQALHGAFIFSFVSGLRLFAGVPLLSLPIGLVSGLQMYQDPRERLTRWCRPVTPVSRARSAWSQAGSFRARQRPKLSPHPRGTFSPVGDMGTLKHVLHSFSTWKWSVALPHKNLKCENGFGSRSGERLDGRMDGRMDGWMKADKKKKKEHGVF